MKLFTVAVLAVACLAETSTTPEPETIDIFFGVTKGEPSKLLSLEREHITFKTKMSGFIVMGMKESSEIADGKSPVRLAADVPLEFVVRSPFAVAGVDPNTFYALRLLHATKKKREFVFMTGHAGVSRTLCKRDSHSLKGFDV